MIIGKISERNTNQRKYQSYKYNHIFRFLEHKKFVHQVLFNVDHILLTTEITKTWNPNVMEMEMSSSSVLNSYNSEQPTLHQSNVKVQRISLKALSTEPIDWLWPLFMSISLIFILLGDIICFWLGIPLLLVLITH